MIEAHPLSFHYLQLQRQSTPKFVIMTNSLQKEGEIKKTEQKHKGINIKASYHQIKTRGP